MDLLCEICDRSIIENPSEYNEYKTTVRKKYDKSLFEKYANINMILDEVDKILDEYITTHNKKFCLY